MSTDSGYLVLLLFPVLAGLIGVVFHWLTGFIRFIRDLFDG